MAVPISVWNYETTKSEVSRRYKHCQEARKKFLEDRWARNERIIYSTSSVVGTGMAPQGDIDGTVGLEDSGLEASASYIFKNFRFIHAQMSANPPSVAMRPVSSDQEDHRKADAADRVTRWSIRKYNMQEKVDQLSLHALLYGTGILKTVWDSSRGDIIGFDEESGKVQLEGDIAVSVPFIWNMYIDPDAKSWDEVKYVIERIYMDYNEACTVFGHDKADILKKARVGEGDSGSSSDSELDSSYYNSVELLEYWETGLPSNGYLGRYCITTPDGEPLKDPSPSPFRFRQAGSVAKVEARTDLSDEQKEALIAKLPEKAGLPYHLLSDIDIPNCVWGRSFIEYAANLQENLDRLDTAWLDNLAAHSAPKLVVPKDTEVAQMGNDAWHVTEVDLGGSRDPYYMSPPSFMPEMGQARQNYITGINDLSGVNESMFGQQSREQSGASMQYATNQGNMIRRRLFNKYVLVVESVYKGILNLVRKHWSVSRTIHVLGKEKALLAVDLKGADIDGGYDVIGEYGVTLSLDPITRREEIITLQPLFKEAGIPPRKALEMMKLNELEGLYDKLELAGARQKEIFDLMTATNTYIQPKKFRDHENMIAWALDYFMSSEFESLPPESQVLCEQHIEERAQVAAMEKSGAGPQPAPQSPGPAPSEPAGEVPAPAGLPPPA
jgi:hypothetical protein